MGFLKEDRLALASDEANYSTAKVEQKYIQMLEQHIKSLKGRFQRVKNQII